jgi:hypothetical protein
MNSTPCVRDYMSRSLVTLTPDMRIQDAIEYLVEHEYSGAVVVDVSGKLAGMLSNKDCLKLAFEAGYHQDWPGTVGEYTFRQGTLPPVPGARGGCPGRANQPLRCSPRTERDVVIRLP